MSSQTASVRTQDLEAVLDYLQGLESILRTLHDEERGREGADSLVRQLEQMDGFSPEHWEALRYQHGVGQGWSYVADTVASLRERLVEAYGNAAL